MQASDTILSIEEIIGIRGNDNSFEPADIKRIKRLNKYLKRQAEITWQLAIKEVMDIVSKRYGLLRSPDDIVFWQSKLKEWGNK